jgi:hypothetical protein
MTVGVGRAKRIWKGIREQQGSIRDHRGKNLTGSTNGWASFGHYMEVLCGGDDALSGAILEQIEQAAKEAAWLHEVNQLRFTNPKCNSKPMVQLRVGCQVTITMEARNKDEEDCSDAG